MKALLERIWVRILDSKSWRRIASSGVGSQLLHSGLFERLDLRRRQALMRARELARPELFESVQTAVILIGHVKSGGSLLGAMLDAHPDAVMADEVDIPRYIEAGFSRDQIFHLLVKGARRESLKGRVTARRLDPYSLAVPGQWQGEFRVVRVIGESRAGPTTRRLGRDPSLLDRLRDTMVGVDVRFIHVVRSPWDPIGAMVMRSGKSLPTAVAEYQRRCEILSGIRSRLTPSEVSTLWYEDLASDPTTVLTEVCDFLGLEPAQEYLDACASLVRTDRPREREGISWTDTAARDVRELIAGTPFLNRYEGEYPEEIAWRTP